MAVHWFYRAILATGRDDNRLLRCRNKRSSEATQPTRAGPAAGTHWCVSAAVAGAGILVSVVRRRFLGAAVRDRGTVWAAFRVAAVVCVWGAGGGSRQWWPVVRAPTHQRLSILTASAVVAHSS